MPEKRDYTLFVEDIINSITKIKRYTQGLDYKEFSTNELVIDAVIRNFEIIGESANNIPEEIQKKYNFVEWKEITGFRNVLIHGYFTIEIEMLWDTIKNNLPDLEEHIQRFKLECNL